ncbi:MAG: S46 family peptidase [Ignavibacteriales bacterium]|nr:S46 family peptidase [Ignavibacteriales bacterium]
MFKRLLFTMFTLIVVLQLVLADEGMYPISELYKLNLKAKGLKIDPKAIYNPNGIGLIDAVVQLSGCTGSFVSKDGLIITNHHCAFGAVQAASTKENDYVTYGFLAKVREEEIQARGISARILESYKDVSKDVLGVLSEKMDLADRTKAIEKKIREIVAEAEKKYSGKRAEVSEMFAGKTYVLFLSTVLRDVRLVYVPPRSIGEFGGENDNWVWPRHTGDFSFLRAYATPDGSPAEYASTNVPYHPKKFLKVNPAGVDEGDFAFILGYPGRTFRHRTSHYMAYEENIRMPYVADLYDWQIATMEAIGKNDRAIALKHDARIKGLANTMKNYRGKLLGMNRLHLTENKQGEEQLLQQFIDADKQRKAQYGTVLEEIGKVYQEMSERGASELILDNLRSNSQLLSYGFALYESAIEMQKPDMERLPAYTERNLANTKQGLKSGLRNYYEPTDRAFLKHIVMQALALPENQRIEAIEKQFRGRTEQEIDQTIDQAYAQTKLTDESVLLSSFGKPLAELQQMKDPFIGAAQLMYATYQKLRETRQRREGALSKLSALLVDVKQQYQKTNFIPDANSTLRFTFGRIKGYTPADATHYSPITTLTGVIEKTTGKDPYATPQKVLDLYKAKDFGKYKNAKLKDVPVAILYDMDTTGGNSGSPVMNAKGELIGVNFDRAYEATINDYAWSESYSRSIAVDIRYVLWVTEKVGGAAHVLKELGL